MKPFVVLGRVSRTMQRTLQMSLADGWRSIPTNSPLYAGQGDPWLGPRQVG